MGAPSVRALAPLLIAVFLVGIAWSLVTPPWQAPDENSHFAYAQYLAESGSLPGRRADAPTFSTEQVAAAAASNADLAAAQRSIKMQWDPAAFARWQISSAARDPEARSDGGGPNPASSNPPLYYLAQVPAYYVASGGDVFARLEVMRIASLIWLLVAVGAAWLLVRELLPGEELLQLLAAGVVGFAPMMLFVSSSVSPDSMLYATWAIVLWLGVRLLRRPPSAVTVGTFAAAVGAACVVKATSYALLPAACFAVAAAIAKDGGPGWGPAIRMAGVGLGGLALTLGVWLVVSRALGQAAAPQVSVVTTGGSLNIREFLSYLWQFYLPKTGLQTDFASVAPTLPAWDFLVKGSVASFGWTEVEFDSWVYWTALAAGVVVALGAGAGIWRDRARVDPRIATFLALVVVALMAGLHISEYRQLDGGALNFFQGRYVLPLAPLAGLAAARAALWLRRPWRGRVVAGTLSALLTFNLFSLGLVLSRFYA